MLLTPAGSSANGGAGTHPFKPGFPKQCSSSGEIFMEYPLLFPMYRDFPVVPACSCHVVACPAPDAFH